LDEERLHQLDMISTFHQTELLLPRLMGIRHNIWINIKILESILEDLLKFNEARGLFTQALEDFLAAPFLFDSINTNEVNLLVQECRIIESINMRYLMGLNSSTEIRRNDVDTLTDLIPKAIYRGKQLNESVEVCMNSFRMLTKLD